MFFGLNTLRVKDVWSLWLGIFDLMRQDAMKVHMVGTVGTVME
jgi:hypothetical protein